jgi:hypothetical protein
MEENLIRKRVLKRGCSKKKKDFWEEGLLKDVLITGHINGNGTHQLRLIIECDNNDGERKCSGQYFS